MKVVVDANVMVALVVPSPYSQSAADKIAEWIGAEVDLVAPAFWSYEAVSAVRKLVAVGQLDETEAAAAVSRLWTVGPFGIEPSEALHVSALAWAGRLRQFVAYDAAYLALAELLGTELWTADQSLVRNARSLGVDWIHEVVRSAPEPEVPSDSPA